MSNNLKVVIVIIVLLLVGGFIYKSNKSSAPVAQAPEVENEGGIVGCYVSKLGNDVYKLNITGSKDGMFTGSLRFDNYQKDSSHGLYVGDYVDGILLGNYTFASEGTTSVMQVIFKKSGDSFVRGYGEMNADGTTFKDINNITYDPNQTFSPSNECAS